MPTEFENLKTGDYLELNSPMSGSGAFYRVVDRRDDQVVIQRGFNGDVAVYDNDAFYRANFVRIDWPFTRSSASPSTAS
jgi:hypothetical protein